MSTEHTGLNAQNSSNDFIEPEKLYPKVEVQEVRYPSLAEINRIDPLDFEVAPIATIRVQEPLEEEGEVSPFTQPASASHGISRLFSWLVSSEPPPKRLVEWGKDGYPAKQDFIDAAELYWDPRKIYIPKHGKKAQYDQFVSELEAAHTNYMKLLNRVSTLFSQKVSSAPLSERITQYNEAIQEVSELFRLIVKQRQVERDLRGFFVNHLIEQEKTTLTSREDAEALIRETLLPFAATGDRQHPFARVIQPQSGVQYVTLGKENSTPNLYEIPNLEREQARIEKEIQTRIGGIDAPLSHLPSPATLADAMAEVAGQALQKDTPVNLLEWKAELKQLHEHYRAQVRDGASPLNDIYRALELHLLQTHTKLKLDSHKLQSDSSESNKAAFMQNLTTFNNVKHYFNGVREAMGAEAPRVYLMTQQALDYTPEIEYL